MSDERSCHFCREPAEVALDDHHIVPKSIVSPKEEQEYELAGQTQVLCSNCHRKFHSVLDPALEYVASRMREKMEQMEKDVSFDKASDL